MSERDQTRRGSGERTPIGYDRAEQPPEVRRPRGTAWRRLEAEGVTWEGQVLIVGEETDLAARLIVTRRRVAFVRGGEVVLDVGRDWLKPPPLMLPDGTIALSVTLDGGQPEDFFVQVREGRRVAGHLVTLLGGSGVRRVRPAEPSKPAAPTRPTPIEVPATLTATASSIPGPLFPDEVMRGAERPTQVSPTWADQLSVRPDPSPPYPYEPSWTRARRARGAAAPRTQPANHPPPGAAPRRGGPPAAAAPPRPKNN
jgi:hypothetical protein